MTQTHTLSTKYKYHAAPLHLFSSSHLYKYNYAPPPPLPIHSHILWKYESTQTEKIAPCSFTLQLVWRWKLTILKILKLSHCQGSAIPEGQESRKLFLNQQVWFWGLIGAISRHPLKPRCDSCHHNDVLRWSMQSTKNQNCLFISLSIKISGILAKNPHLSNSPSLSVHSGKPDTCATSTHWEGHGQQHPKASTSRDSPWH